MVPPPVPLTVTDPPEEVMVPVLETHTPILSEPLVVAPPVPVTETVPVLPAVITPPFLT